MRTKQTTAPSQVKPFNLEEWRTEFSEDGEAKRVFKYQVLLYQVTYQLASGLKKRNEIGRKLPGTFFKIVSSS
jgi:hypothetical protein